MKELDTMSNAELAKLFETIKAEVERRESEQVDEVLNALIQAIDDFKFITKINYLSFKAADIAAIAYDDNHLSLNTIKLRLQEQTFNKKQK